MQQEWGERRTGSPCFPISGAYGAALLALESVRGPSRFHGFDAAAGTGHAAGPGAAENIAFYQRAGALLLEGSAPIRDPGKKTVGVPYALVIHKFFPMANAFFRNLGFNVLLSPPTNEEIIRLSQQTAQAETCYPVKLLHGHMAWLAEQGVPASDMLLLTFTRKASREMLLRATDLLGYSIGGVHGGTRLGGNAQADIVTFGRIAGQQSYIYAMQAAAADKAKK